MCTDAGGPVTAGAFLELWRRRKSVRVVDGTVLPWLLVTTTNLARNHARGLRRYRALIDALPRSDDARGAGDVALEHIEEVVAAEQLRQALNSLAKSDAALITLTAFEQYSPAQAATALGISEGAARTRLHRARARMASGTGSLAARRTRRHNEGDAPMTTREMDPAFASALREALIANVERAPRRRRRWQWRLGIGLFAGSVFVGGGAALAAGVFSPPGAPLDTQLGNIIASPARGPRLSTLDPRQPPRQMFRSL